MRNEAGNADAESI